MKKTLAFILALFILASTAAFAEPKTIDLAAMSLDELRALQEDVLFWMFVSDEWKEVEIPPGAYLVGDQIPAGDWRICPVAGATAIIDIGSRLNPTKTEIDYSGDIYGSAILVSESSPIANASLTREYNVTLSEGMYIVIDSGPVLFTRQTGPRFSFD